MHAPSRTPHLLPLLLSHNLHFLRVYWCVILSDGQTSPHRPRLVVSRSTCLPLSPSHHANSFILSLLSLLSPLNLQHLKSLTKRNCNKQQQHCNRYCSNKHTHIHFLGKIRFEISDRCKREYRQYRTWVEGGNRGCWGEADRTPWQIHELYVFALLSRHSRQEAAFFFPRPCSSFFNLSLSSSGSHASFTL
jgi:hypothetical protein